MSEIQNYLENPYLTPKILAVNLYVTSKNGMPALELRRLFTDKDIAKMIIKAAIDKRPVFIYPDFSNRAEFENALIEKGFAVRENDGKLYFTLDSDKMADYFLKA